MSVVDQRGKIIDIAFVGKANKFTTTSTFYVDITDLSITITPKSNKSKFMLLLTTAIANSASTPSYIRAVRGSIAIGEQTNEGDGFFTGNLAGTVTYPIPISFSHEDSPATTSPITYKIQCKVEAGALNIGARADGTSGMRTTFIVMEIMQ